MIKMIENLKKLENALKEDKELAAKFETELQRISKEKDAANDGEAFVKAAKAVGFDISMADLEKATAETQELDPEEIETIAGGAETLCVVLHDCYATFLHDTPDEEGYKCWKEYECIEFSHDY